MARNVKVGFILSTTDLASRGITTLASVFRRSWGGMMGTLTGINQGLNLARKAWRLVDMAIVDTVRSALKFRLDGVGNEFKAFGRSAELLRARLGDAMIPVFRAFMAVLKPIVDGTTAWLVVNNKVIASKFGNFVIDLAEGIANLLFPAIRLAGGAFLGLKTIGHAALAAIFAMLGVVLEQWARWADMAAKLARLGGLESVASGLDGVAASLRNGRNAAFEMFSEHVDGANAALTSYDNLDATMTAGHNAVISRLPALRAALAAYNTGVTGGTVALKEQGDQLKENGKLEDKLAAEAKVRAAEARREMEQTLSTAASLSNQIGGVFGQLAGGAIKAKDAMKQMASAILGTIRDAVIKEIQARAAAAAAAAAQSQAGIPVIGPILAVAAASAMFALVTGYLQTFAQGGVVGAPGYARMVTGGIPGKDSVPILAQQGEVVLPVHLVRQLAGVMGRSGGSSMARGGSVRSQVGGRQPAQVNVTLQSFTPASEAQFARIVKRQLVPILRQMHESGEV